MRGTYNFYEDGVLVHSAPNLITREGRRSILRYLAGQSAQFGRALAVGAGDTPATLDDTRLTVEFDRANVDVSSPNYTSQSILYKATLSPLTTGRIYEVGLFESTSISNPNSVILSFDTDLEPWSGGAADPSESRLGPNSLRVDAATNGSTSVTLLDLVSDIDSYALSDTFTLSFYVFDNNTSSVTLRLRATDPANYYQITPTVVQGYNIFNFSKSQMTKTGSLNFSDIKSVEVRVNAKATDTALDPEIFPNGLGYTGTRVHFDALTAVGKNQHDNSNTLISRSVIGGYIPKTPGRAMDIEYVLDLDIL